MPAKVFRDHLPLRLEYAVDRAAALASGWLAAALGQLGRTVEAKQVIEKAIKVAPAVFDMFVHQRVPWHRPEDHAHMLEGLRKAGWRET